MSALTKTDLSRRKILLGAASAAAALGVAASAKGRPDVVPV
jgi:hypothetical protein